MRQLEHVCLFSIINHHRRLTMKKRRIKIPDDGDDSSIDPH